MNNIKVYKNSTNIPEYQSLLENFFNGISQIENDAHLVDSILYSECDIAVFFGSWKNRPKRKHHVLKMDIIKKHQGPKIIIETPLLFRTLENSHSFYRIGIDHFLADLGDFKNKNSSSSRYEYLVKNYGLSPKDWRKTGDNIIVALQLPGDASLRGQDIHIWAFETVLELQKYTDRPIIIRPHPLDKKFNYSTYTKFSNVTIRDLGDAGKTNDLENSWATVTYSSGYGVDSILNGIPTIACDPGNFAFDLMKNNTLSKIEDLELPDKTQWLYDIAYTTWHISEMSSGLPWKHLHDL